MQSSFYNIARERNQFQQQNQKATPNAFHPKTTREDPEANDYDGGGSQSPSSRCIQDKWSRPCQDPYLDYNHDCGHDRSLGCFEDCASFPLIWT